MTEISSYSAAETHGNQGLEDPLLVLEEGWDKPEGEPSQQKNLVCEPPTQRYSTVSGAVFNLSTSIVGAGIMALPYTLKILGLIPGIIMILLVALLTEASIKMLIKYSRAAKKTSYFAVMRDAYRRIGRRLVQFSLTVNLFGTLVVYMVIIGDVFSGTSDGGVHHPGLLEAWFGSQWWNARAFVILLVSLTVFLPLARHKRVGSLETVSAIAVALALIFVVITVAIALYKLITGSVQMPKLFPTITDWTSIWNLFTTVPILVSAYICHYNVHSIDNELRNEHQIKKVVRYSLILCTIVYVATSLFAFLLFGDSTLGDVLVNFSADLGIPYGSVINDIVRFSYGVHIILVFPVVFFALRINLDGLLFHKRKALALSRKRFRIQTVILLAVIYIVAIFIPSIWDAFQIIGATSGVCIGFIFPAAIALKDANDVGTRKDRILAIFMIVISVLSSIVALSSDIYNMFIK